MLPHQLQFLMRCQSSSRHLLWAFLGAILALAVNHAPGQSLDVSTSFPHAETEFDAGFLPPDIDTRGAWTAADFVERLHFDAAWSNHLVTFSEARLPLLYSSPQAAAGSQPEALHDDQRAHGDLPRAADVMRYVWTGTAWYAAHAEKQSYVIQLSPRPRIETDFFAMFNLIDWPMMGAPQGLRKALKDSKVLARTEVDGVLRLRIANNERDTMQTELVYDLNLKRMKEVVVEMYMPANGDAAPELISRVRFVVLDWQTVDGREVPWRAVREAIMFRNERLQATPQQPLTQRFGFVRSSFRNMNADDVDSERFEPPPVAPGSAVVDNRQRISYHIGRKYIVVDGQLFQLPVEIDHVIEPGELAGLLQKAEAGGTAP